MSYIDCTGNEIASILVKEGLDYNQSKAIFKAARRKAGLREVRAIREELAARHGYDVRALYEEAKRRERAVGKSSVWSRAASKRRLKVLHNSPSY